MHFDPQEAIVEKIKLYIDIMLTFNDCRNPMLITKSGKGMIKSQTQFICDCIEMEHSVTQSKQLFHYVQSMLLIETIDQGFAYCMK
jgi:hypothetical protein